MPLEQLFGPYRQIVERSFEQAKADAGSGMSRVQLSLAERPRGNGPNRAEVLAIGKSGPVRVTWNAIASLWATSQGAARLSRRMFDARRRGESQLVIADDPELERGLNCLVLANRFRFQHPPSKYASRQNWPSWAPPIDPYAIRQSDTWIGNKYFGAALGWIFRHELAHLVLGHNILRPTSNQESREVEDEADLKATEWLRGSLKSDPERDAGSVPALEESKLEARAISTGIALLWVAFMEANRPDTNTTHPAVAQRFFTCFEALGLREDSGAKEIIADLIKLWIDPERPGSVAQVSDNLLSDALLMLQRHLAEPRDGPPAFGV